MSDHLCELNDRLMKQNDEIEDLKRPSKVQHGCVMIIELR